MSAKKSIADELLLIRHSYPHFGTFGKLFVGDLTLYTVEPPWDDNKPNESCIPSGDYPIEFSFFERGAYFTYEIKNVPNRTEIKIHVLNTPTETGGCIGLGSRLGCIGEEWGVLDSRKAFGMFMWQMAGAKSGRIRIEQYRPIFIPRYKTAQADKGVRNDKLSTREK